MSRCVRVGVRKGCRNVMQHEQVDLGGERQAQGWSLTAHTLQTKVRFLAKDVCKDCDSELSVWKLNDTHKLQRVKRRLLNSSWTAKGYQSGLRRPARPPTSS
jgi:hypothetical protein